MRHPPPSGCPAFSVSDLIPRPNRQRCLLEKISPYPITNQQPRPRQQQKEKERANPLLIFSCHPVFPPSPSPSHSHTTIIAHPIFLPRHQIASRKSQIATQRGATLQPTHTSNAHRPCAPAALGGLLSWRPRLIHSDFLSRSQTRCDSERRSAERGVLQLRTVSRGRRRRHVMTGIMFAQEREGTTQHRGLCRHPETPTNGDEATAVVATTATDLFDGTLRGSQIGI